MNRPGVSKQASIRRVRRQSELPVSMMMSPDSSQSSSDSVAAWQRLTSTGQKYTPYVVSCVNIYDYRNQELCKSLAGENIHGTKFCDLTQISQIHIIKY